MSIAERLRDLQARIASACARAHRDPASVELLAVSKLQPVSAIRAAYDAGQRAFGENYVQEWRDKSAELPPEIQWHLIGALQTNKVKYVARGPVALVHTIDRLELIDELAKRCAGGPPLPVLVEVNLGGEASKAGTDLASARALAAAIDRVPALRLDGLMAIPPAVDPEAARPFFRRLAELRGELDREREPAAHLRHLSMGMSADFEVAIEEGATIVRVGTALFGPREL